MSKDGTVIGLKAGTVTIKAQKGNSKATAKVIIEAVAPEPIPPEPIPPDPVPVPPDPIPVPPEPSPPTPPSPDGRLTFADLRYVGAFRFPDTTPMPNGYFSFSEGYTTGRPGTRNLLVTGPQRGVNAAPTQCDLVEIAIPDEALLTSSVATTPRAALVRAWGPGEVFKAENSLLPNSGPPDNNYAKITGIHYVGDRFGNAGQLFWSFCSAYGAPATEFGNISASLLKDDGTALSYGPWASSDWGWHQRCGAIFDVPKAVQDATGCGPLGMMTQVRGNAGASPRGGSCFTFTPPSITAPKDAIPPAPGAIQDYRAALWNGADHPAARNTHYVSCGSNLANDCSQGGWIGPAVPTWGCGLSTTLDWLDTAVWIHGPSKRGYLGFGQMAEQFKKEFGYSADHVYSGDDPTHCHVSYGGNPCCHGQTNGPVEHATGPRCETIANKAWIWDEDQMIEVLKGTRAQQDVPIAEEVLLSTISSISEQRTALYQLGGAWFDATNKRLYVIEAKRERINYDFVPVGHVFEVNC